MSVHDLRRLLPPPASPTQVPGPDDWKRAEEALGTGLPSEELTGWCALVESLPGGDSARRAILDAWDRGFHLPQLRVDEPDLRGAPPWLADLLARGLRREPAGRPSLAEWIQELMEDHREP